MLRMGIPNKGRLSEKSLKLLNDAGFIVRAQQRKLSVICETFDLEVVFSRASDIPVLLDDNNLDLGITGEDFAEETNAKVKKLLELDFGRADLVLAAPKRMAFDDLLKQRCKVATSFPRIAREYCDKEGIDAEIVPLNGAVELATKLGIADAVIDLTTSGETLRMNDLLPLRKVLSSQACLFASVEGYNKRSVATVLTALESVMAAHQKKFLFANVPKKALKSIRKIVPGLSGPTITSVFDCPDLCAVQVVVDERKLPRIIEELQAIGATGILVANLERVID